MYRKFLFLLFLEFFSNQLFSQKDESLFKLTQGLEHSTKTLAIQQLIGSIDDDFILVQSYESKLYLERWNGKGEILKSTSLNGLKHKEIKKLFLTGFIFSNKLYLRFTALDNNSKMSYGMIDEYDINTLEFVRNVSSDFRTIADLREINWFGTWSQQALAANVGSGNISRSKKFMVDCLSRFDSMDSLQEKIILRVYDSNMALAWEKQFDIPYKSELFKIDRIIIDEEGNVHLMGINCQDDKRTVNNGKPNFKYHVLSFIHNGSDVIDNIVDINGLAIQDATIVIGNDGHLMLCGFYCYNSLSSIDGSFFAVIDFYSQKIVSINENKFSQDFIKEGMKDVESIDPKPKEMKGKESSMENYFLDRCVAFPDGSFLMMAEQYYQIEVLTSDPEIPGLIKRTNYYSFDDVILIKINPVGETEWTKRVRKSQISKEGPSNLSYSWFYCNGKICLIYNTMPYIGINHIKVEVIDDNGELTSENIMGGARLDFHPRYSMRLSECNMLLYSTTGKKCRFGKLEFK
jgi:hypothetical protein